MADRTARHTLAGCVAALKGYQCKRSYLHNLRYNVNLDTCPNTCVANFFYTAANSDMATTGCL